jgi:penicillin-insensitive murein DD-endopeptidase
MHYHSFKWIFSAALILGAHVAPAGAQQATKAEAVVQPVAPKAAETPAAPAVKSDDAPEAKIPPPKPGEPAAKLQFGAARQPAPLAARAIGNYSRGCLSGAEALPIDGDAWQAMRLSRNRNWGHPKLVATVRRLASEVKANDGWPGLLVGDLSQPRGGPMLTGHASHQIGLDADIWLTPMPDRRLSREEREEIAATSMLAEGGLTVDKTKLTDSHIRVLKRAASYPEVERVLVHPAIKKSICERTAKDADRKWLYKVRPIWGHHYHFHVRIACPAGSVGCVAQKPVPGDDGCGKEVDDWLKLLARPKKLPDPNAPKVPAKPKAELTLSQLPADCRVVLQTPQR